MLGPRALTTASAPAMALSMASLSDISPITTRTRSPHVLGIFAGLRA
jgi:hypothetical protein